MAGVEKTQLGYWQLSAYAGPAMVTSLAWMPLGYVIVKFYAKYTTLDLATIGAVIFIARIFDAVSDPVIACVSDTIPTRWGRRKPWIVLSAPIVATGFALVFMPPSDIHWTYFLVANITLYIGWTFFEITHIAWGLEIANGPGERARLGVLLKVFAYIGSLLFFAFPFLFNSDPHSSEFTRPVMNALGLTIAITFPLLTLFSVKVVPRETRLGTRPYSFIKAVREIAGNRDFRIYASAFLCWTFADAVIVALFLVYVDVYLNLSSHEGAILLAAYFSRLFAAPFAYRLLTKYPHCKLWCYATLANAGLIPLIAVFPRDAEALVLIIIYSMILGSVDCLIGILIITLLGEVIEKDGVATKRDKAASYKATTNLIEKSGRALGTSGSLVIVGQAGLTINGLTSGFSIGVLVTVLALAPALLNLLSSAIMKQFNSETAAKAENSHVEFGR